MNGVDGTGFRMWFEDCLRGLRGRKVEWPQLLRHILCEKVQEIRSSSVYYAGEVFIDRDGATERFRLDTRTSERIQVRQLYRLAHEQREGLLKVGQEDVWLVTWEVPNQGGEASNKAKGRRVDLLGVRRDGSLVVFECKGAGNSKDSPLFALLEGLDYLGCLLTPRNMEKLKNGFRKWRDKKRDETEDRFISRIPADFRTTEIDADGCHKVVVLAPAKYFQNHERDSRGLPQDWWFLSDRFWKMRAVEEEGLRVQLDFATTAFSDPTCELLDLPWLERV